MFALKVRQPDWQKAMRGLDKATEDQALRVMEGVGSALLAWFQGLTEEERGWATITGELARGYAFEVTKILDGARLTLRNDVEHAVYLEARDGFFILTGVADPGGPLEEKLVEVCAKIAPEFRVVRSGR
jgi:hypothetical protein